VSHVGDPVTREMVESTDVVYDDLGEQRGVVT